MKGKRFLAVALSAAMVLGNGTMAFADDYNKGHAQGSGEVQYVAVGDVFSVVLPTNTTSTFNYLLDPEGLIAKTNADRYDNKSFEPNQTVYFQNSNDAAYNYSSRSNKLTVINKSTQDVNLTLDVNIEDAENIVMATSSDALRIVGGDSNFYMAVEYFIDNHNTATSSNAKAITTDGVKIETVVPVSENAYEVRWNKITKQYEKQLASPANASWYGNFTFNLTGACRTDNTAALTGLRENAPNIDIIWSVDDFTNTSEIPSVTETTYKMNGNVQLIIPVDLGSDQFAATDITSIKWIEKNRELLGAAETPAYFKEGIIRIAKSTQNAMIQEGGATIKITFNNSISTTLDITLVK